MIEDYVPLARLPELPYHEQQLRLSLVNACCVQVGRDISDDPEQERRLFNHYRRGLLLLFESPIGRIALSESLTPKEFEAGTTTVLAYKNPKGLVLAERIEASLTPNSLIGAIGDITARQGVRERDVLKDVRDIWRRSAVLEEQGLMSFMRRNEAFHASRP